LSRPMNDSPMNETENAITNPSDVMLTKAELAERLKLNIRTVENWQRRGILPFVKVGKIVLFHWPDVVEHLTGNFRVCRRTILKQKELRK
jgi:excisionase family DNA binding protein